MANQEHLNLFNQGTEVWNTWRRDHPGKKPNLSSALLHPKTVKDGQRNEVNLSGVNLREAKLITGNLTYSNLSGADLTHAFLSYADLSGANLSGASLTGTQLFYTNLSGANLTDAHLTGTHFEGVPLSGASFDHSHMQMTIFVDVDFREVKGLETVQHHGPSEIGISTIYHSEGKIPGIFLRGCGVPETFIVQIPSLVAAMQPIQFYSCFISYSSKDQKFAERLYADLQNKGVRCWYAPEDLKIGERLRIGIDESIRVHDKLLLILSKNSIGSEWVEKEVETAMERERRRNRTILFPIRLDNSVLNVESGWAADIRRSRNIGDFRRWKNHDTYSKAFERLLRDLKAGA